jgi:hypothetical protein
MVDADTPAKHLDEGAFKDLRNHFFESRIDAGLCLLAAHSASRVTVQIKRLLGE